MGDCGRKVELYLVVTVLVILLGDHYRQELDLFSCKKQRSYRRQSCSVHRAAFFGPKAFVNESDAFVHGREEAYVSTTNPPW